MAEQFLFTFANPEDPKAAPLQATVLSYRSVVQAPQLGDATTEAVKSATEPSKAHHGSFNMTMELDEASLPLFRPLWSGKHIDKGTLTCFRAAGETGAKTAGVPYLTIYMEAVVITSMTVASSGGGGAVIDATLAPAKTSYTFIPGDQSKGTGK